MIMKILDHIVPHIVRNAREVVALCEGCRKTVGLLSVRCQTIEVAERLVHKFEILYDTRLYTKKLNASLAISPPLCLGAPTGIPYFSAKY